MTKREILTQLESQDWYLSDQQKVALKKLLMDYEFSRSDIPYLKKIAERNDLRLKKLAAGWWKKQKQLEIVAERKEKSKTYYDPLDPNKRVVVIGKRFHRTENGILVDMPDFSFPEGIELPAGRRNHVIINFPDWVTVEIGENGKEAYAKDEKGEILHTYRYPVVTVKGHKPYRVFLYGDFVREETNYKKINWSADETWEYGSHAEEAIFVTNGNDLGMRVSAKAAQHELQAWDDTDTSGTNDQDSMMYANNPTTNYSSDTLQTGKWTNNTTRRSLIDWTMPSDPGGTVTDVDMDLTTNTKVGGQNTVIQELTETWVDNQVTWSRRSTGNTWTTAGGTTAGINIDEVNCAADETTYTFGIMGSNADNPLTLDWTDSFGLLIRDKVESTSPGSLVYFDDGDGESDPPLLTVTYTAGGSSRRIFNIA